jgi:hypothetical protein
MEPERQISHSQQPATGLSTEPDALSPHISTHFP